MSHSVPLSFTPAAKGGHQTIGKNGSFWLPSEQSQGTFASHLKNQQQVQKQGGSSVRSSPSSSTVSSNGTKLNPSTHQTVSPQLEVPKSSFHSVLSESKQTPSLSGTVLKAKIKEGARQMMPSQIHTNGARPQTLSHQFSANNPKGIFSALPGETAVKGKFVSLTSKRSFSQVDNSNVKSDFPELSKDRSNSHDGHHRGSEDGAKDAIFPSNARKVIHKSATDSVRESSKPSLLDEDTASFHQLALHHLTAIFSRSSFSGVEVVRFAHDLPNGDQVSVRIQFSPDKVDMSVICPNENSHDWLKATMDSLLDNLRSILSQPVDYQIFESFDAFDRLTANQFSS